MPLDLEDQLAAYARWLDDQVRAVEPVERAVEVRRWIVVAAALVVVAGAGTVLVTRDRRHAPLSNGPAAIADDDVNGALTRLTTTIAGWKVELIANRDRMDPDHSGGVRPLTDLAGGLTVSATGVATWPVGLPDAFVGCGHPPRGGGRLLGRDRQEARRGARLPARREPRDDEAPRPRSTPACS
jgi:hypothetical protein